ncbi:helix-turn-helix domain-containing protein [Pseudomonas frederiksbergensis]|uniref:helix-turn-helix domain-containing protein n=1 Tax=Pseudomonas frederiksbergensis TaxID=104087 RepID=UPI0028665ED0|nr:helix-turn-helix transcriptional regulator [Pseudomonas frederiksbergensis]MDR7107506.1 transcriptional regulator with XRE-family HTH domain [Pseudomonas frederiksbergensis]
MELKQAFGLALKRLRTRRGLTQEDFSFVSSRTYLSTMERGLKCPTLEKLEELASVLGMHPLSVLALAYEVKDGGGGVGVLLDRVRDEVAGSSELRTVTDPSVISLESKRDDPI